MQEEYDTDIQHIRHYKREQFASYSYRYEAEASAYTLSLFSFVAFLRSSFLNARKSINVNVLFIVSQTLDGVCCVYKLKKNKN